MSVQEKNQNIITFESLKSFFYGELESLNNSSLSPVPQETLFYSSEVLEKYCLSQKFFDTQEGRIRNKILGEKLLQATKKNFDEQRRLYRDVGDTALILCGYFSESINDKIVDKQYYINIGSIAYRRLNSLQPDCMDIPAFFDLLSKCFESLTLLINSFANKFSLQDSFGVEEKELLIRGISAPNKLSI